MRPHELDRFRRWFLCQCSAWLGAWAFWWLVAAVVLLAIGGFVSVNRHTYDDTGITQHHPPIWPWAIVGAKGLAAVALLAPLNRAVAVLRDAGWALVKWRRRRVEIHARERAERAARTRELEAELLDNGGS